MGGGSGASTTRLQDARAKSRYCLCACKGLHVLQAFEDCLTTPLPVKVGFKNCCLGVAHRLASAVLVIVSCPEEGPPALVALQSKSNIEKDNIFKISRAGGCLNLLRRVWMAGGREGSTRDGNDPWKEREVIGTQQRPGFRVRILLLSYLKEKERLEGWRSNRRPLHCTRQTSCCSSQIYPDER